MQHFANLAGEAVLPMAAIDVLTRQLLELTAEVPYYAATVARARLMKAHQRLQSGLANPDTAAGGGWPGQPTDILPNTPLLTSAPYCVVSSLRT